jgi:division/cell wall cluster transcriptional repressor MraZ
MRRFDRGSPELHELQRDYFGQAEDLAPDRQGRVLLPERLRNWAQLDRELVFVGCFDRIEIWGAEVWKERNDDRDAYQRRIDEFLDQHGSYASRMQKYFGGELTGER